MRTKETAPVTATENPPAVETAAAPTETSPPVPDGAVRRKQTAVCKLTIDERIAVSTDLCLTLTERDRVEEIKKSEAKRYADQLGGLDTTIETLKRKFETGVEDREIEVYDLRDIVARKIHTHRVDTGALLDERDMKPFELQLDLTDLKTKVMAAGESPGLIAELDRQIADAAAMCATIVNETEEQVFADTPEEAEAMRDARLAQEAADRAAAGDPPSAVLSMRNPR